MDAHETSGHGPADGGPADGGPPDIEDWLRDACRDLGLDAAGATTDFFTAGGTSLTAIKLIARAEEAFGEDVLPPEELFAESTLGEIAACIRRNRRPLDARDGS